jgi:hypothetical protein
MQFLILVSLSAIFLSLSGVAQEEPIKAYTPSVLTSAGFRSFSFLQDQDSVVAHLPDGIGDYCSNWIKAINTTPRDQLPKEFFPKLYRAILCRPVDGKCRDPKDCALSLDRKPRPKADYVALPKDGLKLEKNGLRYEFESEVELEFQNKRGKYRNGKYAALFNLENGKGKSFWLCSIPVEITSTSQEAPPKRHDILTCSADQMTHQCPGIGGCLDPKNKIESHNATMAAATTIQDDGLTLRRHKTRTEDEQVHSKQGI